MYRGIVSWHKILLHELHRAGCVARDKCGIKETHIQGACSHTSRSTHTRTSPPTSDNSQNRIAEQMIQHQHLQEFTLPLETISLFYSHMYSQNARYVKVDPGTLLTNLPSLCPQTLHAHATSRHGNCNNNCKRQIDTQQMTSSPDTHHEPRQPKHVYFNPYQYDHYKKTSPM